MLSADYQNEEISSFLRPKWGMKKSVTGDSMTLIRHCCWFPASKRGNSWNTRRVNFCVPLLTKCNGYQKLKPPIGFEHLNDGWQFFSRKFQASKAEILGDMSGESLGRHLFGNPTRYQALQASASGRRHEWYRAGPALCSENSAQRRQRRRCWRRMEGSRPRPSRTIRRSSLWLGSAVDLGEGWCVWCAIASTPLSFDVWFCDTTGCFLWFVDAQYMSRPWKLYRLYMMHGQKKVMIWGSDLIPTPGHPGHPGRLQDGSIDGKQPSELRSYKLLLGFESLWFFSMVDHCGPGNLAELGPWELKQWTKVTWWLLHHSPLSALWQVWFAEVRGSTDANCLKVTWTPPFHTVLIHFGIFQSVDFTWLDWYLNCTVMLLFK